MYKINKLKYGLVNKPFGKMSSTYYFTLLEEIEENGNIYYLDFFNDNYKYQENKDDYYVVLVKDFNFSDLLINNNLESKLKIEYTKEELKRIMEKILRIQNN